MCAALIAAAPPAFALDVFTLWRRPEAPLSIATGDRVDYRTTTLSAGRRTTDLVRVQCVGDAPSGWLLEILPLEEKAGRLSPLPGEGVRLRIDHAVADRKGDLADHVVEVVQWRDGASQVLSPEDWRDDPLVGAAIDPGFVPQQVTEQGQTTRVVGDADLLCRQFTMSSADTVRIALPRGEMIQIHTREVSAAVHPDVPFLGVAFAAERSETRSKLVPAGKRSPPPPSVKVETMELVGFGHDAKPSLGGT